MKTTLQIQNLKCGGCENTITTQLSKLEGVSAISVNHEASSITFKYSSEDNLFKVKKTLSKLGYPVVGENNHLVKKATSYVSCAIGKITKETPIDS